MALSASRQPFFFFVLDDDVYSTGVYLTICLYWHVPQDCDAIFFSHTVWDSRSYHFAFELLLNSLQMSHQTIAIETPTDYNQGEK